MNKILVALGFVFLLAGAALVAASPLSTGGIPQEWLLYSNYDDSSKTQITSAVTLTMTVTFPDDGRPTRLKSLGFVVLEADNTAIRCTDSSWSSTGMSYRMTRDGEFFGSGSVGCNGLSTTLPIPSHPTNPAFDYQDAGGHSYVISMTIVTPPVGESWYVHADIGGINPVGVCAVNPANCLYQDALQRPSPAVIAGGTTAVAPVSVSFSWSASADNHQLLRFVADATTDSNYDIVSYVWDFGDGTPVLTQTVGGSFGTAPHIYVADGVYKVTLTAFDDGPVPDIRKASVSAEVEVAPDAPPDESPIIIGPGDPVQARYLTAGLFGAGTALLLAGVLPRRRVLAILVAILAGVAVAAVWALFSVGAFF